MGSSEQNVFSREDILVAIDQLRDSGLWSDEKLKTLQAVAESFVEGGVNLDNIKHFNDVVEEERGIVFYLREELARGEFPLTLPWAWQSHFDSHTCRVIPEHGTWCWVFSFSMRYGRQLKIKVADHEIRMDQGVYRRYERYFHGRNLALTGELTCEMYFDLGHGLPASHWQHRLMRNVRPTSSSS